MVLALVASVEAVIAAGLRDALSQAGSLVRVNDPDAALRRPDVKGVVMSRDDLLDVGEVPDGVVAIGISTATEHVLVKRGREVVAVRNPTPERLAALLVGLSPGAGNHD